MWLCPWVSNSPFLSLGIYSVRWRYRTAILGHDCLPCRRRSAPRGWWPSVGLLSGKQGRVTWGAEGVRALGGGTSPQGRYLVVMGLLEESGLWD